MKNFEYTFINSERDEKYYTALLNTMFQEDRGYTIHDREDIYSGYHSTLVCKHNGIIIGGICAYISDARRLGKLPMERRGIELKKYIDLRNMRYAEICRAGVVKDFRKYHIYPELMKRCVNFCFKIGCQAGFWIAGQHQSTFYENELSMMGFNVKKLDVINLTQMHHGNKPKTVVYHLSVLLMGADDEEAGPHIYQIMS